ncbi:hypothetical protein BDR26DRAFT_870842 [Obelidium mucronatum]|nr:hypothetical protein BDR26DRAFT_870842 [Obelidium mucronatum]
MPLEIIGAGFGRTGTTSLKAALEHLGYPTYHMLDCDKHNDYEKWLNVISGPDYGILCAVSTFPIGNQSLLLLLIMMILATTTTTTTTPRPASYTASIDWPGSTFYMAQMLKYPNAKVILTVRDDAEAWYDSFKDTILHLSAEKPFIKSIIFNVPWLFNGTTTTRDKETFIRVYNEWIDQVKANVPPEKLLVFNVKDGLGPAMKLKFPNVNTREDFIARVTPYWVLNQQKNVD